MVNRREEGDLVIIMKYPHIGYRGHIKEVKHNLVSVDALGWFNKDSVINAEHFDKLVKDCPRPGDYVQCDNTYERYDLPTDVYKVVKVDWRYGDTGYSEYTLEDIDNGYIVFVPLYKLAQSPLVKSKLFRIIRGLQ